jgi:hypothetical protein
MVRSHKMDPFGGQSGNEGYSHDSYLYPQPAPENSGFVLGPDASNHAHECELVEDKILSEILSELAGPIAKTAMPPHDMGLQSQQCLHEQNPQAAMSKFGFPNSGFEIDNMAPGDGLSLPELLDGYHPLDSGGEMRRATLQDFQTPISAFGFQQEQSRPLALSAGLRVDSWPKALEDYLMASKKNNCTFPEISAKILQEFGIERSANVLSKKYRTILKRDAENSVSHPPTLAYTLANAHQGIMQFLTGATPILLQCLQDEMSKVSPEIMNEELRAQVWEELQRKLPKLVRTLAVQTRKGA